MEKKDKKETKEKEPAKCESDSRTKDFVLSSIIENYNNFFLIVSIFLNVVIAATEIHHL